MPTYACNYENCTKTFTTASALTEHLATHRSAGQKYPYVCNVCGRLFQTKEGLYNHTTASHPTYHIDLPYPCPYCKTKFATKSEMDLHVKATHVPTTFVCPYCCSTFNTKEALLSHTSSIHNVTKTYKCSFCPLTFQTREELIAHESAKHGGGGAQPYAVPTDVTAGGSVKPSAPTPSQGNTTPDDVNPILDPTTKLPEDGGIPDTRETIWQSYKPLWIVLILGAVLVVGVLIAAKVRT